MSKQTPELGGAQKLLRILGRFFPGKSTKLLLDSSLVNQSEYDRTSLLYEISATLNAARDFETIVTTAVGIASRLGATSGEIHLLANTGEVYCKSTYPERNELDDLERQTLVRRILTEGLEAWVLETSQSALVLDTRTDDRWLPVEYSDQTVSVRSAICSPILVGEDRLRGAISLVHPQPNHFNEQDMVLLGTLASQIATALESASLLSDLQSSLQETHLILDISRRLSGASSLEDVYDALVQSIMATGADRSALHICDELDNTNTPIYSQVMLVGDKDSAKRDEGLNYRFPLAEYPILHEVARTQETLVIETIKTDERLSAEEREFLSQFGAQSIVLNPLVSRSYVIGLLTAEYRFERAFGARELALHRTFCNQTTIAIEHARQRKRTEEALAETQTLYRAGRVLAGAADLAEILQEALIEFVYSLGLDQGGITLLTLDRQFGQLMAYLESGQLQDIESLRFQIRDDIAYQQILLSGRPFISTDVPNDPSLVEFKSFNPQKPIKSTLQAPMIMQGETIGWIGVDAVREQRDFTQAEADLARAMADQIAIAIQNRRLLEQTELRAERLRAVAKVGENVAGLMELGEALDSTVDLIRDQFGFYHVSIFLIDESREWAVVRASTGEVGKIMVERPHRLGVGSNSIVGFATANAIPRIALDVGEDAVHFENPLLPDTRSEMALPLISRGLVIGALDVQSVEPNAFTNEDVETLQIMANQITTAIENAHLFEQTQQRLNDQAMLYRIGTKVGATLNLQETTDILVAETAEALNVAECALSLIEENAIVYTISDYVKKNSHFRSDQGKRFNIKDFATLPKVLATKQELIINVDASDNNKGREFEYLKAHHGTILAVIPILLRNEVIGFLELYDDRPGRQFSQEDISLLDSIALQAANTIETARLFESAHESQAFMKAIIDQIPDPIFIKDEEHKWVVVNTAFAEGLLGQPEENILGRSDYDFLPKEQADWFWEYDSKMFETGEAQETEEPITDSDGDLRTLYTRKIPLTLTPGRNRPEYLIGIINDITRRKQREAERERLIEETRQTLDRTQALYRISDTLATATEPQATFEGVLGEYLQLLGLKQGSIMLFDEPTNANQARARYIDGQAVPPTLSLPVEQDLVFQHLQEDPNPLIIEDVANHPLMKDHQRTRGQLHVTSMLFIPLLIRGQLVGSIVLDVTAGEYSFNQNDIEIGEAIADQLTIWLENRQLLTEAQYRSSRLQTAAEVSGAASSILDIDELINTSVNLIRDQFDFYYVGMFLVDEDYEWAVLTAGTGEAGRIQLERNHRLRIGGESMIGWSINNRRARIALDVGEDAVHFQNPYLPDTHSEMALPLISRDRVIGALTVQSVERGAFSDEDITLLQTMADQLANAIENASLFAQTQEALSAAEALYQTTQELFSARDEEMLYQLAMNAISNSGIDSSAIYMYVDYKDDAGIIKQMIEQKAIWTISGDPAIPNGTRFEAADFVIEQLVPRYGSFLIKDIHADSRLTDQLRQMLTSIGVTSLMILPLSTHQSRLGFLLVAYNTKDKKFTQKQTRFYTIIVQQMVVALENLRLLDASQKRVRREEIIREITGKIRNAVDIDDVLKTTVGELGKVLGASRGNITLGIGDSQPQAAQPRVTKSSRSSSPNGGGTDHKTRNDKTAGNKENENHGQ